jgi:hypothetical protein
MGKVKTLTVSLELSRCSVLTQWPGSTHEGESLKWAKHDMRKEKLLQHCFQNTCGTYYKHIMIIFDASTVVSK